MFVIKGRLIATICLVGFLVAGLGMYAVFQSKPAEAHCSTTGRIHDYYDWNTGNTITPTGETGTLTTNCSRCTGQPASNHAEVEMYHASNGVWIYKHRWFYSSNWTHCHSHSYSTGYLLWHTVQCNHSGSGGGG